MRFIDFMDLYDNHSGITVINNDDLSLLARDHTYWVVEEERYSRLWDMEVVSFGFYDNEFCVRVKQP